MSKVRLKVTRYSHLGKKTKEERGGREGRRLPLTQVFPSALSFWTEQPRGDTFKDPSSRPLGLRVPAQEVCVTRTRQYSNMGCS